MKVVRRRTLWPSKPFREYERGTMFSATIGAYLLAVFAAGELAARMPLPDMNEKVGMGIFIAGFFPFAFFFRRAWVRLLRTPKPTTSTAEAEESTDELAAWASSTLDKKRRP